MDLREGIRHALDGEAILFLGAGFSYGGKNKKGTEMKVGAGLSHAICDDLGIEHSDDLTITASRYLEDDQCKKSLEEFIDFLCGELECVETTSDQDKIIKLPWKRIYTTNYDNIIEKSSEKQKIIRESITITNERYVAGRNLEQAIVHINGYIKKIDKTSFFEEFKITDDNYNRDGLLQSSWRHLFETDLRREQAIIFIGYSMKYDQELVRCIANLNIKDKCLFIDIPGITGDTEFKIKRYGELYKIGLNGLAEEVEQVSSSYVPKRKLYELVGFEKVESSDYFTETSYSSVDIVNLLIKGEVKREFINQDGYCIHRKAKIRETLDLLEKNRVVILQSKLGNGKSIFLECLASELSSQYHVYFVNNLDNYMEDLQYIQSIPDVRNVLLIDDYGYYVNLLKEIGRDFPDNLKLILTCRTVINLNLYYDLISKYDYSEEEMAILDLDVMSDSEVQELIQVFDKNRLWGEFDTLTPAKKKKKVKQEYHANASQIFYLLMESEIIKKQIEKVMQILESKRSLKEFVMAQAINSLCRLKLGYSDICKFVQISDSLLRSYHMNPDVGEIIDIQNHKFILSSAIFSQYLVRQSEMKDEMIDMLEKIYIQCSNNDEWNKKYVWQRKYLISRSNIKLVFSSKGRINIEEEKKIFSYYDHIKNLTTATKNPFFWLQFAITATNLKEYNLAEIYFKTAYANAGELEDFDSYQIDTHYARFLLSRELDTNRNDKESALNNFKKAHKLLYENSNRGAKLIYVLKQTGAYYKYYEFYKNLMEENEQKDFVTCAWEVVKQYQEYFGTKEIREIPLDIVNSYQSFRKIFVNTPYVIMLKNCDNMYNLKVKNKRQRV